MAARAEGRTLDCDALFAFSRKALQETADVVLIEGVGGIMVPLDDENTVLDWIVAAGAPVGPGRRRLSRHDQPYADGRRSLARKRRRDRGHRGQRREGASVPFAETLAEIRDGPASPVLALRRGKDGASLAVLL